MSVAPHPSAEQQPAAVVPMVEYERVCEERDNWQRTAEQRGAELRQLEAFLSHPNLTGEQVRRVYAVVKTLRNAPPDPAKDGYVNPDLFEIVRAGGIPTEPAYDSKEAKKKAFKNAMANASRYLSLAEELGIVEKDEPVYLRQDPNDPRAITGSVIRARLTAPPERVLYAAAESVEPKPAKKTRGCHVPVPTCPKCGSKHTLVKCEDCGWKGTGVEWSRLEALRQQDAQDKALQNLQLGGSGLGLQNPQTNRSICLQKMQADGEGGLNHLPPPAGVTDDPPEDLPDDLKRFARINEARTNEGAAYAYARAGFRIFPIYEVRPDGSCACRNPDCDDVGKHPYYEKGVIENGCKAATTDIDKIRGWWRRWPDASIAWATDGYAVIDPDAPEKLGDPDGLTAWPELRERYQLEVTLTARTGGGGLHAVYSVPDGAVIGNSSAGLPPGIHVRGAGGYIVVSPSVHKSGQKYEWIDIRPIAPLPQVLIDLLTPKPPPPVERRPVARRGAITTGSPLYKGQRNEELARVAGAFAGKCGLDEEGVIQALLETNENRCKPSLPEGEVVKIARSISKKERSGGGLAFASSRGVPRRPPAAGPPKRSEVEQTTESAAPALSRACCIRHHTRVYLNDAGQSVCATCWPLPPNSATEVYELP